MKRLSRPDDGRVMCQLCFEYFWPADLYCDEYGAVWDVCNDCHEFELDYADVFNERHEDEWQNYSN